MSLCLFPRGERSSPGQMSQLQVRGLNYFLFFCADCTIVPSYLFNVDQPVIMGFLKRLGPNKNPDVSLLCVGNLQGVKFIVVEPHFKSHT